MKQVPLKQQSWQPIVSESVKQQVMQCVQEIGRRLQNPETVGQALALSGGLPGICLLWGEMDAHFPEQAWDLIGHQYLMAVQGALQDVGLASGNLFGGMAGVLMGVRALTRGGTRYQTMEAKLRLELLERLEQWFPIVESKLETYLAASDFDTIYGISGVARYLLTCAEHADMRHLLQRALRYLVRLSGEKEWQGQQVPAWYIPFEKMPTELDKQLFPNGNLNLGLSHGIAGPLAILSLALQHGVEVEGQRQAITRFAEWLQHWQCRDEYGPLWPGRISWENWQADQQGNARQEAELTKYHRESWCYGTPGIARALWLAGVAMDETGWKATALEAYHATFRRPFEKWGLIPPSFCHGLAGLLQLTRRMQAETGDAVLAAAARDLTERVLSLYRAELAYGFFDIEYSQPNYPEVSKPGLLEGAAGTALTLLSAIRDSEPEWDQVFLIG